MLHVTLRQLEYIVAVGKAGSLALASAHLNVSQPALSVAIAQVETRIGEHIFLRRKGVRITPTSFGHLFLREAEALITKAEALELPGALAGRGKARVALGILSELAPRWLAPITVHLQATLPLVDFVAYPMGFSALVEASRDGRIDIGLTYDLGLGADFRRDHFLNVVPRAWVGWDDPFARRPNISLSELAERPLILSDHDLSMQHMIGLFRRVGQLPVVRHRAASIELMRSLAANGEGTGISYTNPLGRITDDGKPIVGLPIGDEFAVEPIVLINRGVGITPMHEVLNCIQELAFSGDENTQA
ncbi:LysR family transcriptional regulator [Aestuariivirga sp.]|uniref:LysR family transcriptional regulator n=1 Tax=Aestuariivirga sp. TaxID=2650926 RepID=UPI003BA929D7